MTAPRMRPTFMVHLSDPPDRVMGILRSRLEGQDYAECTRSKGRCADFFVDENERRLWSPFLSVQVEPAPGGSILRGRYGPHPEVWTLFVFLYAVVGFLAVMGLLLGFVQLQSGMTAWGLWGAWIGFPGLVVLYGVSALGQHLGAHQMVELRRRIDVLVEGLEAREVGKGPISNQSEEREPG